MKQFNIPSYNIRVVTGVYVTEEAGNVSVAGNFMKLTITLPVFTVTYIFMEIDLPSIYATAIPKTKFVLKMFMANLKNSIINLYTLNLLKDAKNYFMQFQSKAIYCFTSSNVISLIYTIYGERQYTRDDETY